MSVNRKVTVPLGSSVTDVNTSARIVRPGGTLDQSELHRRHYCDRDRHRRTGVHRALAAVRFATGCHRLRPLGSIKAPSPRAESLMPSRLRRTSRSRIECSNVRRREVIPASLALPVADLVAKRTAAGGGPLEPAMQSRAFDLALPGAVGRAADAEVRQAAA